MSDEIPQAQPTPTESPTETNIADQAFKAAAELRAANAEKKLLLDREERLIALRQLGGRSEAGIPPVVESEEEKIKRAGLELLRGTGLNPYK